MRHDENIKTIVMIPGPRTTTANGASVSAATYGTTGSTKGLVDVRGWDRARIRILKQTGTAQKATVRLAFQSASTTLFVSATALSGTTSGIVMNGVTTSGIQNLYDINLASYSGLKAFLNCKVTTSTTSGNVTVLCDLVRGEQFPPSTTGFTTITRYG